MSAISDVYDALQARLAVVFPSHKRLTNPYRIDNNLEQFHDLAYGVALGPAANTRRNLSCNLSVQRDMNVVLVRKFFRYELDRTTMETAEKALLEDQFLLIKDVEADPKLNVSSTVTALIGADYEADGGIEFIYTDRDTFLALNTIVKVEYLEDLN